MNSQTVGIGLSALGLLCLLIGIFVLDRISIEYPGIFLEPLGYYFGLSSSDRTAQILVVIAVILNVVSMLISGLAGSLQ